MAGLHDAERQMAVDDLPERIRAFLFDHIHSFEELEMVALMQRDPALRWTEERMAEALRISPASTRDALKALVNRGMVRTIPERETIVYAPSEEHQRELAELAALYAARRLEIVMQMSANSIERMRTGAMRTFADCFFVGRNRKDG